MLTLALAGTRGTHRLVQRLEGGRLVSWCDCVGDGRKRATVHGHGYHQSKGSAEALATAERAGEMVRLFRAVPRVVLQARTATAQSSGALNGASLILFSDPALDAYSPAYTIP